jgi:acyl carrier protein
VRADAATATKGVARGGKAAIAYRFDSGGRSIAETTMSALDEELIDIIAEEALIDRAKLDPAAKLEDIGLDSVDLVSVVFAIEEKYGIQIAEDAFDRSDTLGAVIGKIEALIAAKGA